MTAHRSAHRAWKAVLVMLAVLAALVGIAIATGRIGVVSTNGVSMNPVYYQGDLVVVARDDTYQQGQVVAYRDAGNGIVALHRIVGGDGATGFEMKGDNNQSVDVTHPTSADVLGRAILRLPHLGSWLHLLTSPYALAVVAFALTVAGSATPRARRTRARRTRRAAMSHPAIRTRWPRSLSAMPSSARITVGLAAAVAALGFVLGAFAWTTPTHDEADTTTQSTQRLTFSYTAAVPLTAAYDGDTVISPEPVFRRLTNLVDLRLDYEGAPGTLSVDAYLSTPGGWKATVPLAPPAAFSGHTYGTTVPLDLTSLAGRAAAAAAVTGVAADSVTVTIAPTVRSAGAALFTPTLPLQLTPLQLTLIGDPGQLVATMDTPVVNHTLVTRTLGTAILHSTVAQARTLAAALLVAALLAAGAALLGASRTPPLSPGAQIRRRYAPLLAAVDPMTTPPHIPVIDVAEFATMVKVAERYGLLVMHWSRSDVDTFLVLDEAATYRYRTGPGPQLDLRLSAPESAGGNHSAIAAPSDSVI